MYILTYAHCICRSYSLYFVAICLELANLPVSARSAEFFSHNCAIRTPLSFYFLIFTPTLSQVFGNGFLCFSLPPPLYHAFALLCFVWELIYIPSIDKASHVPMWSPRTVIYRICPKPKREHSRICIATVVTTPIRAAQKKEIPILSQDS